MNAQLKKGVIDICVLSAVKNEPSYGYKIISDLKGVIDLSESTLYPVLRRLEQAGNLTTFQEDYNGRLRKYYRITDSGKTKIKEFIEEWDEMEIILQFINGKGDY